MDQDGFNTKYITLGNELVLTPRFNPANDKEITYMSYFRNMLRVYIKPSNWWTESRDFRGMTFAPRFSPDGKKRNGLAKDGNLKFGKRFRNQYSRKINWSSINRHISFLFAWWKIHHI